MHSHPNDPWVLTSYSSNSATFPLDLVPQLSLLSLACESAQLLQNLASDPTGPGWRCLGQTKHQKWGRTKPNHLNLGSLPAKGKGPILRHSFACLEGQIGPRGESHFPLSKMNIWLLCDTSCVQSSKSQLPTR